MNEFKLEMRTGLPDVLRVLLDEFPRHEWEGNDQFHGLISFWLERHLMFRQIMSKLVALTQQAIDDEIDQQVYASQLSRYARFFVEQLHGHHHIEDAHFFPVLSQRDHRLSRGFTILDSDHQDLDAHLHFFTDAANKILKPDGESLLKSDAGQFLLVLNSLDGFLNRHLVDEEELVVPLILKYGSQDLY